MLSQYQFFDNYPYYPLNEDEGFIIRNFNVVHIKEGEIIKAWDFNTGLPEGAIERMV